MDIKKFMQNTLNDLKIELTDEFDRNFQRKAFFDKAWPKNKLINQRGSMMMRNGHLRNSIESRIQGDKIIFSSSLPYASIHNEGGEITVTPKMKSYFWAMYYKTSGGMSKRKDGTASRNQRNQRLSIEANVFVRYSNSRNKVRSLCLNKYWFYLLWYMVFLMMYHWIE